MEVHIIPLKTVEVHGSLLGVPERSFGGWVGLSGCFLVFCRENGSFWAFLGDKWGGFGLTGAGRLFLGAVDPRFWLV
jgi:hypothetical protein